MKLPLNSAMLAFALLAVAPPCTAQFAQNNAPMPHKPGSGTTPPGAESSGNAATDPNTTLAYDTWNAITFVPQIAEYSSADVRLNTPVHVEMTQATIQQALNSLTSASGVSIKLDKDVNFTGRLSIEARSVPLKTVMEGIAQQTHLMIVKSSGTYLFSAWPSLTINGQKRSIDWPGSPWSGDLAAPVRSKNWFKTARPDQTTGVNLPAIITEPNQETASPTLNNQTQSTVREQALQFFGGDVGAAPVPSDPSIQSVPAFNGYQYGAANGNSGQRPGGTAPNHSGAVVQPGLTAPAPDMIGGGLAITSLGDKMFVVSEPDRGPNGGPGYRLTVYRMDTNDKLRKISSLFHPSAQPLSPYQMTPQYWNYWGDSFNQRSMPQAFWLRPNNAQDPYVNLNSDTYQVIVPNSDPGGQTKQPEKNGQTASKEQLPVQQTPKLSLGPPNEQDQPLAPPVRPEEPQRIGP